MAARTASTERVSARIPVKRTTPTSETLRHVRHRHPPPKGHEGPIGSTKRHRRRAAHRATFHDHCARFQVITALPASGPPTTGPPTTGPPTTGPPTTGPPTTGPPTTGRPAPDLAVTCRGADGARDGR